MKSQSSKHNTLDWSGGADVSCTPVVSCAGPIESPGVSRSQDAQQKVETKLCGQSHPFVTSTQQKPAVRHRAENVHLTHKSPQDGRGSFGPVQLFGPVNISARGVARAINENSQLHRKSLAAQKSGRAIFQHSGLIDNGMKNHQH